MGIKLADGLYDKASERYFISYLEENQLTWNLPYIIHQADLMASKIENESADNNTIEVTNNSKKLNNTATLKKQFDELFN